MDIEIFLKNGTSQKFSPECEVSLVEAWVHVTKIEKDEDEDEVELLVASLHEDQVSHILFGDAKVGPDDFDGGF
jgi:hypothetical protein